MDIKRRLETAATTPINYAYDNAAAEVNEQSLYPDFAAQLRENGFNENTVFDLVAQLSALVQQSRQILPRLTAEAARQFEARVLLSHLGKMEAAANQVYLEKNRQEELELAAKTREREREFGESDSHADLLKVNDQLSSLNATLANQAHDVAKIKWLEMIDGLFGH